MREAGKAVVFGQCDTKYVRVNYVQDDSRMDKAAERTYEIRFHTTQCGFGIQLIDGVRYLAVTLKDHTTELWRVDFGPFQHDRPNSANFQRLSTVYLLPGHLPLFANGKLLVIGVNHVVTKFSIANGNLTSEGELDFRGNKPSDIHTWCYLKDQWLLVMWDYYARKLRTLSF